MLTYARGEGSQEYSVVTFVSPTLRAVESLSRAGFAIHRLHPRSKRPIGEDWTAKPVLSFEALTKAYRPGENLGVRLGQWSRVGDLFLHVLDLDIRTSRLTDEARTKLGEMFSEADSWPAVISGSGGQSRHFYFLSDEAFPSRKLARSAEKMLGDDGKMHWCWEIELFGTGKEVVIPPSIHPVTGRPYAWETEFDVADDALPYVAAGEIRALFGEADGGERPARQNLSADEIATTLADLPFETWGDDRDGWYRAGMAIHHETGGSEEGYAAWTDFSKRSERFDAKDQRRVWNSFKGKKSRLITMASLVDAARDARIDREFEDLGEEAAEVPADLIALFEDLLGGDKPQPEGRETDTGFVFESAASWTSEPPEREWLVRDLIPLKTVTLLGGDGGTGKSLLALQASTAVATGRRWIGREIELPGIAMLLSAEDDRDELQRRLADIRAVEGVTPADLSGLFILSTAGKDSVLAALDSKTNALRPTARYSALDGAMRKHRPRLLVLDTLADLHSGNQNDQQHARQFVGLLRRLAIRHKCAVLFLAHPSKSGMTDGSGMSGSMAWNNSVRSRLYFARIIGENGEEEDTNARVLRVMKSNYGPIGEAIELEWKAKVFRPTDDGFEDLGSEEIDETPPGKARRIFLRLLDATAKQGIRVSPNLSNTYAPTVFQKMPRRDREGISKGELERAMHSLLGIIPSLSKSTVHLPKERNGSFERRLEAFGRSLRTGTDALRTEIRTVSDPYQPGLRTPFGRLRTPCSHTYYYVIGPALGDRALLRFRSGADLHFERQVRIGKIAEMAVRRAQRSAPGMRPSREGPKATLPQTSVVG